MRTPVQRSAVGVKKKYVAKLGIVIEEADECGYWLDLLGESGTVKASSIDHLMKESDQLLSIFTSLVKR